MKLAKRIQRLKGQDHDGDHFWPGYVDALVNVVLNLLFLLAILTMAAFTLGQQVGRTKQGKELAQVIEKGVKELIHRDEPIRIQAASEKRAMGSESEMMAVYVAEIRSIEQGLLFEISTPKDAWRMGMNQTNTLMQSLESNGIKNARRLTIWTNTNADPQRMRQDYLRVLQMREWLIESGINPKFIRTRLIEGGTEDLQVAPIFIHMEQE